MISKSLTGKYTFNNSWMGVYAAKLQKGDDAADWARRMLQDNVHLFDDTCLSEVHAGRDDYKKTPEIGAHGVLICNITQMLLNGDNDKYITIFPAIPETWQQEGVAFSDLAAKGGLCVSAKLSNAEVNVTLENKSSQNVIRELRVRLRKNTEELTKALKDTRIENGWAIIPSMKLDPQKKIELLFVK